MDEGTRQASQVDAGAERRTPEEIEREIQATREDLGETVEALASKADVKSRAKERVEEIRSTTPQNPLPFAIGGALLAGFLIGRLTSR